MAFLIYVSDTWNVRQTRVNGSYFPPLTWWKFNKYMHKRVLQFPNLFPLTDEAWYLSREIIVTYSPKNVTKSHKFKNMLKVSLMIQVYMIYSHRSVKLVSFPSATGSSPVKSFEVKILWIQIFTWPWISYLKK